MTKNINLEAIKKGDMITWTQGYNSGVGIALETYMGGYEDGGIAVNIFSFVYRAEAEYGMLSSSTCEVLRPSTKFEIMANKELAAEVFNKAEAA
jgi:hypothetical protein